MVDVRQLYLDTAAAVVADLDADEVAAAWDEPSALDRMPVAALAAHAARALSTVRRYVAGAPPPPGSAVLDAPGYVLAVLPGDDDGATDRAVLARAEQDATAGHAEVVRRARDDLALLRGTLPALDRDHALRVLDGVVILLDEYLATRIVELVVHHDDLAASLPGVTLHALPDEAGAVAVGTLAELARRRTSTTAMVRALARRERAPTPPPRAF